VTVGRATSAATTTRRSPAITRAPTRPAERRNGRPGLAGL